MRVSHGLQPPAHYRADIHVEAKWSTRRVRYCSARVWVYLGIIIYSQNWGWESFHTHSVSEYIPRTLNSACHTVVTFLIRKARRNSMCLLVK